MVPGTLLEGGAVRCVTPHAHLALTPPRPESGDVAEVEVLPDGSLHLAFDAPLPPPPPPDSFLLPPTLLPASLLPRDFFPAFDYFVGPATHAVARAHCQQLGGDLASIHSQAENDQVVARIAPDGTAVKAHIGFTDMAVEGSFAWTDGTAVTYTNWGPDEPNDNGEGEDCTALAAQHLLYSTWNDVGCEEELGYACRGATLPPPAPPVGVVLELSGGASVERGALRLTAAPEWDDPDWWEEA